MESYEKVNVAAYREASVRRKHAQFTIARLQIAVRFMLSSESGCNFLCFVIESRSHGQGD